MKAIRTAKPKTSRIRSGGKGARRKGQAHERSSAEQFRPLWANAERGIGQARASSEVPDVKGTPFWIECKHYTRSPNVMKAMLQGQSALTAYRKKHPEAYRYRGGVLVVAKQTNVSPELATVPLSEMLRMLKAMKDVTDAMMLAVTTDDMSPVVNVLDAFDSWLVA